MRSFFQKKYLKELLLSAVMLTLVLGPFQPLIAHAQDEAGMSNFNATTPQQVIDTSNTVNTQGQTRTTSTAGADQTTAAGTQNSGALAPKSSGDAEQCSWLKNWDLCITNVVYVFTVGIGSGFAYVAAYFFDLAVNLSLNGPAYALTFISTGWTTARDLANMAFLFILIYIAFTIMLEAETSGTMSLLAGVIVVALLVNFSFFFTRVVIDAGNILSIQFYNSITAPSVQSSAQTSNVAAGVTAATGVGANTKDLTASIMGMLQLQNLFNTDSFKAFYNGNKDGAGATFLTVLVTLSFLYIATGIMFYLITVMFVTAGVKFLTRIIVLWFLIIASPLAFVARAMPEKSSLRHYFNDWREMLFTHAFYPVAFMFIFLILTNFTNQMGNCTNNGTSSSQSCLINDIFTSLPAGTTTNPLVLIGLAIANVSIRMGFVIGILYIGMKASDKISVVGAQAAASAGNWMGGKYISAMGAAGRNTAGFAGYKLGQTNAMQTWARKDPFVGRTLFKGFNKLGASSFDARTPLGALGVKTSGKAQKDGYKGDFDARVKRREKEAEQYSNELTQQQKDEFAKNTKESQDKYQKDLAAENERARKAAETEVDGDGKKRDALAFNIEGSSKIQKEATKAQLEAAKKIEEAKQKIEDLKNKGEHKSASMDAAIAERKKHEADASTHESMKIDATTKLNAYLESQKKLNDEIANRAKELTKKIEATEVEPLLTQRKGFANDLESGWRNRSRLGFWIPAADKKAAAKIRKGKSEKDKLWDAVKEEYEKEHKTEEKPHEPEAHSKPSKPAASSSSSSTSSKPAGDGGHGPAPH